MMKHIGHELNQIIEREKLVKKEIADKIGITPTYLSQIMNKTSIDCALLDRICNVIGIKAGYFFEEDVVIQNHNIIKDLHNTSYNGDANVNITHGEVELLKKLLDEKDRTIKVLMQSKGFEPGQ